MPTQKKRHTIDTLRTELSGSRGLILSSYRGLTVSEFAAIRTTLRAQGIVVAFARVKQELYRQLQRAGVVARVGAEHFYPTLPTALAAFQAWSAGGDGRNTGGDGRPSGGGCAEREGPQ